MVKRKPLLFFTLVFAIIALFAGTQVMAQDLPLSCTDDTFTMTPGPGDFPRFEQAGSPDSPCPDVDAWVWDYIVSVTNPKKLSDITQIFFYAPSESPATLKVISTPAVHVYKRGEGALNTLFGAGIYNGITWAVTNYSGASTNQIKFSFCTQSNEKGLISPAFVGSRFIRGCETSTTDDAGPVGGLIGPASSSVLPFRFESTQKWTVSEGDLTCTIVGVQGSPPTVTATGDCYLGGVNGVKRLEEITLDGKSLVSVPFNEWLKSHGSPGTFTYCYPNGYCLVITF